MQKILIGSVFSESMDSSRLYEIQIRFLKKTIGLFDHIVCTNSNYEFPYSEVLRDKLEVSLDHMHASRSHSLGLNILLERFRHSDAEIFLLLDSDCFPIKNHWLDLLLESMEGFDVAAPVRFENLEIHAHPCVHLFKRCVLDKVEFRVSELRSIKGNIFWDTNSNVDEFFPLIRTNVINMHPLFFGIYWDMFYHHGAGTRSSNSNPSSSFRAEDLSYYKNAMSYLEYRKFSDHFLSNPISFIMKLRGKQCL